MFPLLATIVSLAITVTMWYQYRTRHKPYQAVWSVAFTLFTAGTAAEWVSHTSGWSPLSIRIFYLSGAVLTTGYLALGLVWLLWPGRIAQVASWVTALLSVVAAVSLWQAPIDLTTMAEVGWQAMTRPPLARTTGLLFNIGGTLLLVGGTLWSVWGMRGKPQLRNRAVGLLILTLGVMVVAAGGSMVGVLGLSEPDALAVTNSVGAALMLMGIRLADRKASTTGQVGTSSPFAGNGSGRPQSHH